MFVFTLADMCAIMLKKGRRGNVKDLFSLLGKGILWIVILFLSFVGPIMWLLVDFGLWKKMLSWFGM